MPVRNSVVIEAAQAFRRHREQQEVAEAVRKVRAQLARKARRRAWWRRVLRGAGQVAIGLIIVAIVAGIILGALTWLAT